MKQANIKFTYHDYTLLPEDKRYELVEGELFLVPAPHLDHQRILRRLGTAISSHAERHRLGEVFYAPCDVVFSLENVVQPDLFFVSNRRRQILTEINVQGPPDLVIEILSDSTAQRDLGIKRKLYAKYGVGEYWIVDPKSETVEVLLWSKSGYASAGICGKSGRLSSPLFPDLNLPLSEIFG